MADIRHRAGIDGPQERVCQALAARDGLAGWWTRDAKWAYHPLGLKAGLEGGTAMPYPDGEKISSWG